MKVDTYTILVVEDEPLLQEVYELVLTTHGYHVVVAGNGLEALQSMKRTQPNLVLLDMLMPIMNGKEFLRNLNLDEYPGLKIIAYSNLSDSTIKAEMLELGVDQFVLKSSMTPADLVSMIDKTLATP